MDIELTKPPDDDHPDGAVDVTWIDGQRIVVHYAHIPEKDLTVVHGIRCTTPLRTVIDIAPDLPPDNLKRVVTDCLKGELFTVGEALTRIGEPDMADRVGALLLRDELLRRN